MEIEDKVVESMRREIGRAKGWITFLGVIVIIGGVLGALAGIVLLGIGMVGATALGGIGGGALSGVSVIYLIIAGISIWMGVLLIQAGSRGKDFVSSNDLQYLAQMLSKLRLYFLIAGVIIIVSIVLSIVFAAVGGIASLGGYGLGY